MISGNEPAMSMCNELGNIYSHGLTIRQHFAAMAMQGLIAGADVKIDLKELGKQSVAAADALIKELNK